LAEDAARTADAAFVMTGKRPGAVEALVKVLE
jgi:hypothetical protein